MSFPAVEVLDAVDDSIILAFLQVELDPYPISSSELGWSNKFDLPRLIIMPGCDLCEV